MIFKNNEELVEYLIKEGYISENNEELKKAFLKIKREDFVPEKFKSKAYIDEPIPIGNGQTTSAPCVIAKTLDLLEVKKGMKVLELGTGSGYMTALLAELVGENGLVVSMDIFPELIKFAEENLKKYGFKNIVLVSGDGKKGFPEYAPYDRIVFAAAIKYIPSSWIEQLNENGIIVGPIEFPSKAQKICKIVLSCKWGPVIYVPFL